MPAARSPLSIILLFAWCLVLGACAARPPGGAAAAIGPCYHEETVAQQERCILGLAALHPTPKRVAYLSRQYPKLSVRIASVAAQANPRHAAAIAQAGAAATPERAAEITRAVASAPGVQGSTDTVASAATTGATTARISPIRPWPKPSCCKAN